MTREKLSVVEKTGLILECFLEQRTASLRFNEILAGTSLSKATAHRLLADLIDQGFLSQDAQRDEYRLGPLLLSVGALAGRAAGIPDRAVGAIEQLRDRFGETTIVAELHGDSVVPVRRREGLHEMRMNQELGRRYPAYAGATGQVLLAYLEDEELASYLDEVALEELTDRTATTVGELREAIVRIRRAGVGISRGERVPDAIAVSAPVFDGDGRVACALTISGVASRWDRERLLVAAAAVKEAASRLSREVGHRAGSEEPAAAMLEDPTGDAHAALLEQCEAIFPA